MRLALYFFIIVFCIQCNDKGFNSKCKKRELLKASAISDGEGIYLSLYSDSTYCFTTIDNDYDHERTDKYFGGFIYKTDTIVLLNDLPFEMNKIILKHGFVEFVDGKFPFKVQITNTKLVNNTDQLFSTYNDFSLFTYNYDYLDSSYFAFDLNSGEFVPRLKNYDLSLEDIENVDSILNVYFSGFRYKNMDYFKQCVSVINRKKEIEVWIYMFCKKSTKREDMLNTIHEVNDGGECYYKVKLNLSQKKIINSQSNGSA